MSKACECSGLIYTNYWHTEAIQRSPLGQEKDLKKTPVVALSKFTRCCKQHPEDIEHTINSDFKKKRECL